MILDLDEYAEGAILLNGFEDCIVGVVEEFGNGRRVLYDKWKIIEKLQEDSMLVGDAEEYYDYNILGLYAGEQNAVFLDLKIIPNVKSNGEVLYNVI